MITKIITTNGRTEIILIPESVFEKDTIEKLHKHRENIQIESRVDADYSYGVYQKYRLELTIIETTP